MSEARSYYVYALKDPLESPAKPFYIGKGTGVRASEHDLHPDQSLKGQRITAIREAGKEVLVSRLVDELTEIESLRVEAELISAFGTLHSGGILTNTVVPKVDPKARRHRDLIVPSGVIEKSQLSLSLMKEAVFELAVANADGVTNSDVAHTLGLQSDYAGGSKDYLSWSILGLLMREGRLKRVDKKKHKAQVR